MRYFQNDYNAACHPRVLEKLCACQGEKLEGYGTDTCCDRAAQLIKGACHTQDIDIHFLTGGTQTNLTVIAAALRPYQAVVAPKSGHINEHETGAVEATGHKVICIDSDDGKITADQIETVAAGHYFSKGPSSEHMAQPKMVYISVPTEFGTVYSLNELEAISRVCKKYDMYLYADGARLGYALTAEGNDVTLPDLTRLCDAFYIGGTKLGTMFGEALVISNVQLAQDFRYMIKQRGGMLAKGWLLGIQFEAMFEDGLYFRAAAKANQMADRLRNAILAAGYPLPVASNTNQVFTVLPVSVLAKLGTEFAYSDWMEIDKDHRMVRFCTSWSTSEEDLDALCAALRELSSKGGEAVGIE